MISTYIATANMSANFCCIFVFQTNQGYQAFIGLYNIVCTSTAACAAAYAAVTTGTCDTDDAAVLCTGTCSGFADTFVNACPADVCLYNTYSYVYYVYMYAHLTSYVYATCATKFEC